MKKETKKSNKRRAIYTQDYHKAQVILRDPWFKEKISWLKRRFTEVGCPIPKNGFKKYKSYLKWNNRFWKHYSEMEKSAEYQEKVFEITGGKKLISRQKYDQIEKFKRDFLPPIYGQDFREILEHFNIVPDHRRFKDFLEFHLFLNKKEYPISPFGIKWIRNQKTRQMELMVQIYGHTKKEDFIKHWNWIAKEQKDLPDFIGKSKEWENFERDMEIYDAYKEMKKEVEAVFGKRGFSVYTIDKKVYSKLHSKYSKITTTSIRTIVAKVQKRLGEQ
ncbi:MAG: hypothetical protein V1484_01475 [bacterium]